MRKPMAASINRNILLLYDDGLELLPHGMVSFKFIRAFIFFIVIRIKFYNLEDYFEKKKK